MKPKPTPAPYERPTDIAFTVQAGEVVYHCTRSVRGDGTNTQSVDVHGMGVLDDPVLYGPDQGSIASMSTAAEGIAREIIAHPSKGTRSSFRARVNQRAGRTENPTQGKGEE